MDKDNTSEAGSEEQDNDAIEIPEALDEIEDEHEESSCISSLGDTRTADPYSTKVTGGEKQAREMEIRKPKVYTNCTA